MTSRKEADRAHRWFLEQLAMMSPLHPTIVCAWCKVVIKRGEPGTPVSHGICANCEEGWLEGVAHGS